MKNLILTSDDKDEVWYNLDAIVNIAFGLAQNLLTKSDLHGNGLKDRKSVV